MSIADRFSRRALISRFGAGLAAAALEASERARARSLLETLGEARANIRQGVDPALLERERHLPQQLSAKAASVPNAAVRFWTKPTPSFSSMRANSRPKSGSDLRISAVNSSNNCNGSRVET